MAGGWPNAVAGDDIDSLLEGDDSQYPKGFAGITPTSIAAGATTPVEAPLNAFLKPNRLVLGAAACVDLSYVTDLKVGTISLNVGKQGVPCVAFARDAVGTTIDAAVWAGPSTPPIVSLYNNTAGAVVYAGGIFGPVSLTDPTK